MIKLIQYLESSESSSSESDCSNCESTSDDDDCLFVCNEEPSLTRDMEKTISEYTDIQFQDNFRLSRSTAEILIDEYEKFIGNQIREDIPSPAMQCYMTIWYISNQETFRQIAERFGFPKTVVFRYIYKTAHWIASILSSTHLKWPTTTEKKVISSEFRGKKGIPHVIGAIDSSHIRISAPKQFKVDYFNRKQFYSLHLQAVVDDRKKFVDIHIGEPGSMHDSTVLRKSGLLKALTENYDNYLDKDEIILGDLAYSASYKWLVPPYKDFGNLTDEHKKFNYIHSSTRIVVEQAFGLLKGRFRRLRCFENNNLNSIKIFVIAAAVLHNICIEHDDFWFGSNFSDDVEFDNQTTDDFELTSTTRRDLLFRELQNLNLLI